MYRILILFALLLITLVVFSGHMNYFWHEKDISVTDEKGTEHDLGAGRFWFGFHSTDLHVRPDLGGETHDYSNFRSLTIQPDGPVDVKPEVAPVSTSGN
jgi:hypothetical protein